MPVRSALDAFLLGIVVVLLDVRRNGFDYLPDPLGYLIEVFALARLGTVVATTDGRPLWVAGALFLVAAVLSIPGAFVHIQPPPGFAVLRDPVTQLNNAADIVAELAAVAVLATLAAHASRVGASAVAADARKAARLVLFAVFLGIGAAVLFQVVETAALPAIVGGALISFVAFVLTILVVWRARQLPPAPRGPWLGGDETQPGDAPV